MAKPKIVDEELMGINKRPALEALHITEELLDELLLDFVELAGSEMESIRIALRDSTPVALDRHAHSIAGMAANLRLERCLGCAVELESALLARDAIRSSEAISHMERAIDEARRSIRPA